MSDFELFSKYFFYDSTLDLIFNRVTRKRATAFEVSGFVNELDHRVITFRNHVYQGSRVAYLLKNGRWPRTYLKNKLYVNNKTGHRNISWHQIKEKYVLVLTNIYGKSCYCGIYATLKEAIRGKELFLQKPEFKREDD